MREARFRQALAALELPGGLVWGLSGVVPDPDALWPEEAQAMRRAVPARRAEFAGGRVAARIALTALGFPPIAVPMGADRAPVWPAGVTGSISHGGGLCLAVLGPASRFAGIGIDLEPDDPLPADLHDEITRPDEAGDADPLAARRRFSAKEAAFKAQYPLTGCLFGFQALRVDLESGIARFADHPETATISPAFRARPLRVRQWIREGLVLSLCDIPA